MSCNLGPSFRPEGLPDSEWEERPEHVDPEPRLDAARRQLVEAAERRGLAERFSVKFSWASRASGAIDQEELVQAARMGIVRRAASFKPKTGTFEGWFRSASASVLVASERFTTWVRLGAKAEIRALIDSSGHDVSLDRNHRERLRRQEKAAELFDTIMGRAPTTDELAFVLGTTPDRVAPFPGRAEPQTELGRAEPSDRRGVAGDEDVGWADVVANGHRTSGVLEEWDFSAPEALEEEWANTASPVVVDAETTPNSQKAQGAEALEPADRIYLHVYGRRSPFTERLRRLAGERAVAGRKRLAAAFERASRAHKASDPDFADAAEVFRLAWLSWEREVAWERTQALAPRARPLAQPSMLNPQTREFGKALGRIFPQLGKQVPAVQPRPNARRAARTWVSAVLDQAPGLSSKSLAAFVRGVEGLRADGAAGGRTVVELARNGRNVSVVFANGEALHGRAVGRALDEEKKMRGRAATGAPEASV
ncbi:MAG: hypothetical protein ACRBN8_46315 [Nannocystales bacterium]